MLNIQQTTLSEITAITDKSTFCINNLVTISSRSWYKTLECFDKISRTCSMHKKLHVKSVIYNRCNTELLL